MTEADELAAIRRLVSDVTGHPESELSARYALDQDLGMAGDDVTELADSLARKYGEWVWAWPWQRFVQLDEGLSLLFPFMLIWQLVSWPFRGSFGYPDAYERLELGHIAKVVANGEWIDP